MSDVPSGEVPSGEVPGSVTADDLRPLPLFVGLSDVQLADLAAAGSLVAIEPGVSLFVEGQPADAWWVLLEGSIDLVRHIGREDTVVARMDVPGRWAGGFKAWDEQGSYLATGRGSAPGRVFRLAAEVLADRFAAWSPFGAHLIGGVYHTARSIESTVSGWTSPAGSWWSGTKARSRSPRCLARR